MVVSFKEVPQKNIKVLFCHWELLPMLCLQSVLRSKFNIDVL